MAYIIPKKTSQLKDIDPFMITINKFKGLNLMVTPSQIEDNESPDMQNMEIDQFGAPQKRVGYDKVYTTTIGTGKINGLHYYTKPSGSSVFLIAHGTKLYTQSGSSAPVEIQSGLANSRAYFFTMNGKAYMMNGTDYIYYDGTSVATVESVAYIPTVTLGRAPTGGGTTYQALNFIQPGFKDSFSGDGVATTYTLSYKGLDATTVTITVGGVSKTEGTHFTVDRTNGTINFAAGTSPMGAPASGTNNVIITAYKTQTGYANQIKQTSIQPVIFGGDNDTRVFLAGNSTYKNKLFYSALDDPTYFPDLNTINVGSNSSIIKGFSKQLDTLIIMKERDYNDVPIWLCRYELDGSGNVLFPVTPIAADVGCNAKDGIAIIENKPIFIDTSKGIYEVQTTNVKDQKNVVRISDEINPVFLNQINVLNAVAVVHKQRLIVVVEGNAWVYDFRQDWQRPTGQIGRVWYYWTNITASCFLEVNGELYFGDSATGLIYKFKTTSSALPYNDNGVAISAYMKTKILSFGKDEYRKLLSRVFYNVKPFPHSSVTMSYTTNLNASATTVPSSRIDLFGYNYIDYSKWTYRASIFPQEFMKKIRVKKITHIQFKYENTSLDEAMSIVSTSYQYVYQGIVKNQ